MQLSRKQKEEKLQKAAEEVIQRLLAWEEGKNQPTLLEIEEEVLALRQVFGQEMAEVIVAGQEARQPVANPVCRGCGQSMRYKGQKGRGVESRVGGVAIERGYYYCACCQSGFFPPGRTT
jgi:hypothetical protein